MSIESEIETFARNDFDVRIEETYRSILSSLDIPTSLFKGKTRDSLQ